MYKLKYDRPAALWTEALPLGNGSLGAMVYGGIECEQIRLNHDTLWSGSVINDDRKSPSDFLEKSRELIFDGKYSEAHTYIKAHRIIAFIAVRRDFGRCLGLFGALHR